MLTEEIPINNWPSAENVLFRWDCLSASRLSRRSRLNEALNCFSTVVPLFRSRLVCAHAAYGFGRGKPLNGLDCERRAQARSVYESSCGDLSRLVRQHVITCCSHCCNLLLSTPPTVSWSQGLMKTQWHRDVL